MQSSELSRLELLKVDLGDKITNIDFPRPIGEVEAEELIKYFVAQLDEEEGSNFNVSLNFLQNRHYGQRLIGETKRRYEKLDDVIVTRGDTKITGTITSGLPSLKAVSFSFKANYDLLDRPVFTGIDFHVTPGTQLGELKSDSPEIMQNMRNYVRSYFEGNFI